MAVVLRLDDAAVRRLVSSPDGMFARELRRRGARVETEAKRRCPIDTGRLRSSIRTELVTVDGQLAAKVGTNVKYAIFVERGTGIYGPRGQPIRPVRARALRWVPRGQNEAVFAREVRGMKPRPFLLPALESEFPGRVRRFD